MNKDDYVEKKVIELLDLGLKNIDKNTKQKLQLIRNNALDNLESNDHMIRAGKGIFTFASISWNRGAVLSLFSVIFLLFCLWASISWKMSYHADDIDGVDSGLHSDDSDDHSFLDDYFDTRHHHSFHIRK